MAFKPEPAQMQNGVTPNSFSYCGPLEVTQHHELAAGNSIGC